MKKCEVTFRRNQEILLISHQDKWVVNMISTLRTAELIETTVRRTGVAKKKPKCIIHYNTHMHGVDTADRCLAYCTFIRKTVKWPKKVFFYLLQSCLFKNYVTFSKGNPNSTHIIPRFHVRYHRKSDTHIRRCIMTVFNI